MGIENRISWMLDRFKRFNYWLLILPMLALFGMMALDALNLITIRLFGFSATPGHKVIIEELIIIAVYTGITYALLGPGHIRTDILKDHFGPHLRLAADLISYLVGLGIAGFITFSTGTRAINAFVTHVDKMGEIQVFVAPFYLAITISFALLWLGLLLLLIQSILSLKGGATTKATPSAGEKTITLKE